MRPLIAAVAIVIASWGGGPAVTASSPTLPAPSPSASGAPPTEVAASTPVPGDSPAATGVDSVTTLGVGHLVAPHQDTGYIAFFDIRQAPGLQADLTHQGGFMYMLEGAVRISELGAPPFEVKTDGAGYINWGASHTAENPGSAANHAYFLSENNAVFRASSGDGFPQVTRVLYASATLPTFQMVAHTMRLDRVVLAPGGRTAAHSSGGGHGFLVLEGSIEVRTQGAHTFLAAGKASSVALGKAVQILNTSGTATRYLDFSFTADDQPFETTLDRAP
jgi:mannose-6-phosphate isomerase-like protein (cupin superfamily)